MANRNQVEGGIYLTQKILGSWGKHGTRMHETGQEFAYDLHNALTHPCCGNCTHLQIEPTKIHGKKSVIIGCEVGYSPQKIWTDWTPDQPPITCPDCTNQAGRPK